MVSGETNQELFEGVFEITDGGGPHPHTELTVPYARVDTKPESALIAEKTAPAIRR